MITIIKLLVLLFFSLLGYDTITLFLQTAKTNDLHEHEIPSFDEKKETFKFHYGTSFFKVPTTIQRDIWMAGSVIIGFLFFITFLYKKNRRDQENKISDVVSQLKSIANISEQLDRIKLTNYNNLGETVLNTDRFEAKYGINQRRPIFRTSFGTSDGLGQTDECCENPCRKLNLTSSEITENFVTNSRSKPATPLFVYPSLMESDNVVENHLGNNIFDNQLSNESGSRGNYVMRSFHGHFNDRRSLTYNDVIPPVTFVIPEMRSDVTNSCNCKIESFNERLEEVETGLKTTETMTHIWRNRIEQTEEELLELQQQIQLMLVGWSSQNNNTKNINEPDRADVLSENGLENDGSSVSGLGVYKPLQIIADIIKVTKKQIEDEEEQVAADKSYLELINSTKTKNVNEKEDLTNDINKENFENELKNKIENIEQRKGIKEDTNNESTNKPDDAMTTEKTKNEKEHENLLFKNSEEQKDVVDNNEKINKSKINPVLESKMKEKIELQQQNEELKTLSDYIMKEIDSVFGNNNTYSQSRNPLRMKEISPRVPSHIVSPRQSMTKTARRRQQPRCAYSVPTNTDK